jgi:molybdopterin synthase sulfur carrier subunit
MPTVVFTENLRRHVEVPTLEVPGATVAEVLAAVFRAHPRLEGYVLDEGGSLRRHMSIYVDGEPIQDPVRLGDRVRPEARIHVFQALSGG